MKQSWIKRTLVVALALMVMALPGVTVMGANMGMNGMAPSGLWLAIATVPAQVAPMTPVTVVLAVLDEDGLVMQPYDVKMVDAMGSVVAEVTLSGGFGSTEVSFSNPGTYAVQAYPKNSMMMGESTNDGTMPVATQYVTVSLAM